MFTRQLDDALSLALIQPSFAKIYLNIVNEQRDYLGKWLPWVAHANSEPFFEDFAKAMLHEYADGKNLVCALIYHDNLVGSIAFNSIDYHLKKVEIGYWLDQNYQGKGIMTRAVKAMLQIAKDELAIGLAQIRAAEANFPSRAIAERLDFRFDGILRNAECVNGQILHHAIYSYELDKLAEAN